MTSATIETAKKTNPRAGAPYFVNGPVDALFIGGLSIAVLLTLRAGQSFGLHDGSVRTQQIISLGITLSWIVNWPHFAATATRLYSSSATRRQFPITTWVIPLLLIPATILAIQNPTEVAPWFVKIFLIWSPYHFSGQTIGITLLYASRHGFKVSPALRTTLRWFIYGTYLHLQVQTEQVGTGSSTFYGISDLPVIGIPRLTIPWQPPGMGSDVSIWALGVIVLGIVLVALTLDAARDQGRTVPWILTIPIITQLCWFQFVGGLASFAEFVPLFHSLQYLFIAWFIQMREWGAGTDDSAGLSKLLTNTSLWAIGVFVLGAIMFSWGPAVVSRVSGVELAIVTGVIIAAVQIHHFFVDGVIWKLRNPKVRAALSTSLDELTGRSA